MQIPLIKAVVDTKAIYPQPCCPSPFHGYPTALGIKSDTNNPNNLQHVIDETRKILKEKGVEGRLSTWPVPLAMMFTVGATEYAMKVINGETVIDKLDKELFEKCLSDYAKVGVATKPLVDNSGKEFPNFLLAIMGFLTY
jgi:hypothetical protein